MMVGQTSHELASNNSGKYNIGAYSFMPIMLRASLVIYFMSHQSYYWDQYYCSYIHIDLFQDHKFCATSITICFRIRISQHYHETFKRKYNIEHWLFVV